MNFSDRISVIVPIFNEEHSIVETLERLRHILPDAEILLIDGGSDQSEAKINALNQKGRKLSYHRNHNDRGKGHAIRRGIELATRPYVAQLDSDLQFWPEDLPPLLNILLENKADFVCGSRFLDDSIKNRNSVPGLRSLGNRVVSLYASVFVGHLFTDILTGIKIWRREVTESFYLESDSFCYEAELPIKALRCGFRVIDAPVRTEPRLYGSSSVNVVKTSLELFREIPRFRLQRLSKAL